MAFPNAFPWVSGCLGTIVNGVQGCVGYCWLEQGLLYPTTPDMPLHPIHNCPQAVQNLKGDIGEISILMSPLGLQAAWGRWGTGYSLIPKLDRALA